jgi:anthranilate phosphoribosyltransferase
MKDILNDLLEHNCLDEQGAYKLLKRLVTEPVNETHTAVLLSVFIMRDISLAELKGFRKALMFAARAAMEKIPSTFLRWHRS